jgi:hypothetical protein
LTEIEVPVNDYCSSYETMAKEIREGMDEGLNEGIKEGYPLQIVWVKVNFTYLLKT